MGTEQRQQQQRDDESESQTTMITATDEAEDAAIRGHEQVAADKAFMRHTLFAPSAAPATRHPEVGRQLHRLQQLMEENAVQQLQIQQKEREIRAA